MFKNFIITLLLFISTFFLGNNAFADSIKVENIFTDIDSDYKYIHELQTLYDKGMIVPDRNGKFNPRQLLTRDEFMGILMEVTCKDCIQPKTSYEILQKYSGNIDYNDNNSSNYYIYDDFSENKYFYDIRKNNKYFYCINEALNEGFTSGYGVGITCETIDEQLIVASGVKETKRPFCSKNTIILEEAIAIILRASGILTNDEAQKIRYDIRDGIIVDNISDDVGPKNIDGTVYSFYPDLFTALNYKVKDVDTHGNEREYSIIEKKNGKLRPKQAISKEDFLRIAYVTLLANECPGRKLGSLALKINIYDKECSVNNENCSLSELNSSDNIYDFGNEVFSTCDEGIDENTGYIWRFYNDTEGTQIIKYGKYLDNYQILTEGKWKVFLRVIDECGSTAEVYNTIIIGNKGDVSEIPLRVSINAEPIKGSGPLLVNFQGVVEGGTGPYSYLWDFKDGNNGYGKNIENIFREEGFYEVLLVVTDKNGEKVTATVVIAVIGENCNLDTDNDGINDCDDVLPLIPGNIKNKGAPILEEECNKNSDCKDGYICSEENLTCQAKKLKLSCEYTGGDIFFGNVVCNTCPCNYYLDFTSILRRCDIIFPAITSPDYTKIYGKGELFQIK